MRKVATPMEMTEVFEKYGMAQDATPESLELWTLRLHLLIDSLNTESVSTQEFESAVRKAMAESSASDELTKLFVQFRHDLFSILENSAVDSIHAFEWLGDLRTDVKEERDYHTRQYARLNKPKATVGAEFEEGKNEAELIKEFVENLYQFLRMTNNLPETYKVKTMKDGSIKPDLPRIPSGPREGGGRKAAGSNLILTVNEETFAGVTPERVMHDIVSSGAGRFGVSDLMKRVEESGQKFSEGWSDPILVNGKAITAEVVKQDTEESEEDSE